MIKRLIFLLLMFAVIIAGYRAVMNDTHVINDDDVYIFEDVAKECKVYVTPATFKTADDGAFEVTVKRFYYNKLFVDESTFYFLNEGGVIFYRIGEETVNRKVEGDETATAILHYVSSPKS